MYLSIYISRNARPLLFLKEMHLPLETRLIADWQPCTNLDVIIKFLVTCYIEVKCRNIYLYVEAHTRLSVWMRLSVYKCIERCTSTCINFLVDGKILVVRDRLRVFVFWIMKIIFLSMKNKLLCQNEKYKNPKILMMFCQIACKYQMNSLISNSDKVQNSKLRSS